MQSVAVAANLSLVLHENGQQRADKAAGQM